MKAIIRDLLHEFKVYSTIGMKRIRLGSPNDGGYVVLQDLLPICPRLYSFGIGDNMDFEEDFLQHVPGARGELFDPYITDLPKQVPRAFFTCDGLSTLLKLRPPENSFLKVDVEGAEWEFFRQGSCWEKINSFSQIVIELHLFHATAPVGLSPYFTKVYQTHADRLNEKFFSTCWFTMASLNAKFRLIHFHVNNSLPMMELDGVKFPPLVELTFARQDLVPEAVPLNFFPQFPELDRSNKLDRPNYYFIGA